MTDVGLMPNNNADVRTFNRVNFCFAFFIKTCNLLKKEVN